MGENKTEDLAGAGDRGSDLSGQTGVDVKVPTEAEFEALKKRATDLGTWWLLHTAVVVDERAGAIQIKSEEICNKAQEHIKLFNDLMDALVNMIRQGLQFNWSNEWTRKPEEHIVQQYEQAAARSYLGDGVYSSFDGYQLMLTAENGISATDTIYLNPEVLEAFELRMKTLRHAAVQMGKLQKSKNSAG